MPPLQPPPEDIPDHLEELLSAQLELRRKQKEVDDLRERLRDADEAQKEYIGLIDDLRVYTKSLETKVTRFRHKVDVFKREKERWCQENRQLEETIETLRTNSSAPVASSPAKNQPDCDIDRQVLLEENAQTHRICTELSQLLDTAYQVIHSKDEEILSLRGKTDHAVPASPVRERLQEGSNRIDEQISTIMNQFMKEKDEYQARQEADAIKIHNLEEQLRQKGNREIASPAEDGGAQIEAMRSKWKEEEAARIDLQRERDRRALEHRLEVERARLAAEASQQHAADLSQQILKLEEELIHTKRREREKFSDCEKMLRESRMEVEECNREGERMSGELREFESRHDSVRHQLQDVRNQLKLKTRETEWLKTEYEEEKRMFALDKEKLHYQLGVRDNTIGRMNAEIGLLNGIIQTCSELQRVLPAEYAYWSRRTPEKRRNLERLSYGTEHDDVPVDGKMMVEEESTQSEDIDGGSHGEDTSDTEGGVRDEDEAASE
ncbi:hypothetical protein PROFUN_06771 [Planoprotostelium fungivorum]|uniref:Uncharacterized protein n=1 Tax=Planoprotostelium fungivorum TaxID=1890364 RepID=A0A2P6NNK5_9EUKA|nr:hypothetical protein PROFUN_06771 [Planoprotostelium fungivorum]